MSHEVHSRMRMVRSSAMRKTLEFPGLRETRRFRTAAGLVIDNTLFVLPEYWPHRR
jgi:hypothetical protein